VSEDLRYRRPVPKLWWLRKRSYFVFVMRELSSLFVAWLVLQLLLLVRAVSRGEAAYADHLDWAASPWVVALDVVALGFVLIHAVTWFNLTPQAMDLRLAGRPVPPMAVVGAQWCGLALVSAVIAWLVLR
jgi:fumarate reductase subunit C